jgi:hypothetical protein
VGKPAAREILSAPSVPVVAPNAARDLFAGGADLKDHHPIRPEAVHRGVVDRREARDLILFAAVHPDHGAESRVNEDVSKTQGRPCRRPARRRWNLFEARDHNLAAGATLAAGIADGRSSGRL